MIKLLSFITFALFSLISYAESLQPKLIVQIVVDQLRGDLIQQHHQQFGPNGFNYLLNHGLNFSNAHHPHANTTTCAGHATIATGSYPAFHGILDNDMYDRKTRKESYCMADEQAKILANSHTKKLTEGRSPRRLKASTTSDEIVLSQKGKAFAVSLKDRAAITLGGHAGKAFWFDKANGGFVTSSYYFNQYPQWVIDWNKQYHPDSFDWQLSRPKESYKNANTPTFHHLDDSFGQTFPHHIKTPTNEDYFKRLSKTPKADELTADFAIQLLKHEKLGSSNEQTDYFGISFSATDAIGHQFGPNSLEAEDNLIQLDKTIARLLSAIDEEVGLKNTIIVLTADHGVSDGATFLKKHHFIEINPINLETISDDIKDSLKKQYNLPPETLMSVTPPFVYLDHEIIESHKLSLSEVNQYIANKLTHRPGIFKAFALPIKSVSKDWLNEKVNRMAYPYRAGDIYLVQPPYQSNGKNGEYRITHGSPWQYDSYVPLIFVNPKFKAQVIARPVYTTDIAATLSSILMIKYPSAEVGKPLTEVLKAVRK